MIPLKCTITKLSFSHGKNTIRAYDSSFFLITILYVEILFFEILFIEILFINHFANHVFLFLSLGQPAIKKRSAR